MTKQFTIVLSIKRYAIYQTQYLFKIIRIILFRCDQFFNLMASYTHFTAIQPLLLFFIFHVILNLKMEVMKTMLERLPH